MFALVVSCHNLGVAISSALGAWLLATLDCNPRGAPMETSQFQHLWIASGVSSGSDHAIFVVPSGNGAWDAILKQKGWVEIPGLLPLLGISALFGLVPDVRPGEKISTQLQRGDGAWHQAPFVVAPNGFAKTSVTGTWKCHKNSAALCHMLGLHCREHSP